MSEHVFPLIVSNLIYLFDIFNISIQLFQITSWSVFNKIIFSISLFFQIPIYAESEDKVCLSVLFRSFFFSFSFLYPSFSLHVSSCLWKVSNIVVNLIWALTNEMSLLNRIFFGLNWKNLQLSFCAGQVRWNSSKWCFSK